MKASVVSGLSTLVAAFSEIFQWFELMFKDARSQLSTFSVLNITVTISQVLQPPNQTQGVKGLLAC